MDFKTETESIPIDVLARAFRVSRQTIWQYRMDPSSTGYRSPPKDWPLIVAGILNEMGAAFQDRARALADRLDPTE